MDRRLNAYRDDLADIALKSEVQADQYVEGIAARIGRPVVPSRLSPDHTRPRDTECLFGEPIRVFDRGDDWAWVQSDKDGYVGYIDNTAVVQGGPTPTHRVVALRSHVYPAADLKRYAITALTVGAQVTVVGHQGSWSQLADGTWLASAHIAALEDRADDPVAEAIRFIGVPYLWGGRSSEGMDCSALIQFALEACGIPCPRDTDMQEARLGQPLAPELDALKPADLVFWPGHVGMMVDSTSIVHTNATDMSTRIWNLEVLAAHIQRIEGNPIRAIKRL